MVFRNRYVHPDLLKAWSDDSIHVSFYNPVTKDNAEVRDIDSLYYFDYTDFPSPTADEITRLENFLSLTLSSLKAGNLEIIKEATEVARNSLLFQYTRLPIFNKIDYVKYDKAGAMTLRSLQQLKGMDYFAESYSSLCADFLVRVAEFALGDSIALLDLRALFLVPPEGKSFIIGPSAFNAMNPYFEKRFIKCPYVDKAYDIKGAVLVLPITPYKALMLYDTSIYNVTEKESTITLTGHDTDVLNMVQIYNSDIDGVVYKGERESLDELTSLIGSPCCRDGYEWKRGDRFPFSTLLSFLSVRKEEEENMKRNMKSPLRPFVSAMREYDSYYVKSYDMETLQKRYKYAFDLVRER